MSKIAVIGSGFSGISTAAYLAAAGHDVHVFEKNETLGGRARQYQTESGYVFDMGPSWYWMPDVFERFFNDFGKTVADYYELTLLNPAFDVVFPGGEKIAVPNDYEELRHLFESIEPGSAVRLDAFMKEAAYKYKTGIENLVYKPGLSFMEFADWNLARGVLRLQVFSSFNKHVRKYFTNPKLISLMEFPILFLGAMPQDTPALYSLMNYAGLKLGTWYPQGGFGKVVQSMVSAARQQGAYFHCGSEVTRIDVSQGAVSHVVVNGTPIPFDAVVASADYHHVEKQLLPKAYSNYPETYWQTRTFAPSCLVYYVGVNKKINSLKHHTLFFDEDLDAHARAIYKTPQWPDKPLFYVCCPSKTDANVAPEGHENLFLLMPVAPGLEDTEAQRESYFTSMISRLEEQTGEQILPFIDYKKSYCVNDFITDYNAFKGNAYGLANTLSQTAILKPKIRNKKLPNLFYAGQLTVPGPGVPPSIISGKIASEQVLKHLTHKQYEIAI